MRNKLSDGWPEYPQVWTTFFLYSEVWWYVKSYNKNLLTSQISKRVKWRLLTRMLVKGPNQSYMDLEKNMDLRLTVVKFWESLLQLNYNHCHILIACYDANYFELYLSVQCFTMYYFISRTVHKGCFTDHIDFAFRSILILMQVINCLTWEWGCTMPHVSLYWVNNFRQCYTSNLYTLHLLTLFNRLIARLKKLSFLFYIFYRI